MLVFDLDETLVNSIPRRYLAYREVLPALVAALPSETEQASVARAVERLSLFGMERLSNRYDAVELFRSLGVLNAGFIREADRTMFRAYLHERYMDFDQEVPCATTFVRRMLRRGAHLFYVSSRSQSKQAEGTARSLRRLRMAEAGDAVEVILKQDGIESIDFKRQAFARVHAAKRLGGRPARVVGVFENEPENINAMLREFPEARAYFVTGAWLKREALLPGATMIRDYCE